MINKNAIILFGALMILFSCKKETKIDTEAITKPIETFKVELDLVVQEDDSLELFYKEFSDDDWKSYHVVTSPVKGSAFVQQVLFNLPENVVPSEIRLDFGTNKNQKPIAIKNFKMDYYEKSFQAKDTLFYQYFNPNEQIKYDRKTAIATPIYTKGVTYDPLFIPREVLLVEIQKLIK